MKTRAKIIIIFSLLLLVAYYFCLPSPLFERPYSTVIESKEHILLGAKIADDGQWRFPERTTIPEKFKICITQFEDAYFSYHWGFNPISITKALIANIKAGKTIRGGSTLTQQVIRLSRENQKRNYFEKVVELILATRLEFAFSKNKILSLYASHAPFGGNVVGLDMASWRYFGLKPEQLSWAQTATLAVLPNAPALIYPGRNSAPLREKRNRLLKKLFDNNFIDSTSYELALAEPLPNKPHELPQIAPHLLERIAKERKGEFVTTSIDVYLQKKINRIVKNYYHQYRQTEIYNNAVLVVDIESRKVLAYIGNSPTDKNHQKDVDIITAPRSTGSILKPFLYTAMLNEGKLLPKQFVPDIPTRISGYTPQNFNSTYEGAIPANQALSKSLNIPFVLLLQEYGLYKFYQDLQLLHLSYISKHPNYYGLSLILGGAESNLWDLCNAYAYLSSSLNYYGKKQMYRSEEFQNIHYDNNLKVNFGEEEFQTTSFSAGALWAMVEAMSQVNRPQEDNAWRYYDSSQKIAWKTGTSFGNKDAWAIGFTPKYLVGVWVGNATGEGRPSLTGVSSAAPILFEVFENLPKSQWFEKPYDDLQEYEVCKISGMLAQDFCPKEKQLVVANEKKVSACPYHRLIHLDKNGEYRVNANCESVQNIITRPWFVLPPVMEWFYKQHHIHYQSLPPLRSDCAENYSKRLDFIYPKHNSIIYLTKDFNGKVQPFAASATQNGGGKLFWYIDNIFLGTTEFFHEISVTAEKGEHILKIINTTGDERAIQIIIK